MLASHLSGLCSPICIPVSSSGLIPLCFVPSWCGWMLMVSSQATCQYLITFSFSGASCCEWMNVCFVGFCLFICIPDSHIAFLHICPYCTYCVDLNNHVCMCLYVLVRAPGVVPLCMLRVIPSSSTASGTERVLHWNYDDKESPVRAQPLSEYHFTPNS